MNKRDVLKAAFKEPEREEFVSYESEKYYFNPNLIKDNFDDGEIMIYNNFTGEIHILNSTAEQILNLILDSGDLLANKKIFVSQYLKQYPQLDSVTLEEDFDVTLKVLLEKDIIKRV